MRQLLVTGGAGFIGSNFVRHWLKWHPGHRIVVLDALSEGGRVDNLPFTSAPQLRFVTGDIRDTELVSAVLVEERIDTIVNFAAQTHVDRSITSPGGFVAANVSGTAALLEAARLVWKEGRNEFRFHQVSTDEVFGPVSLEAPAVDESARYLPTSPYAATKAAADLLVRSFACTYGLPTSTTYSSNNYGPRQDAEKLIPKCISRVLSGSTIPVYGNGRNVRDWLHVSDHCAAIAACLAPACRGREFNVNAGQSISNIELVRCLCRKIDQQLARAPHFRETYPESPVFHGASSFELVRFVADRPAHDLRYAIDASRLEQVTGFRARIVLDQGLEETVSWYLHHASWLERRHP